MSMLALAVINLTLGFMLGYIVTRPSDRDRKIISDYNRKEENEEEQ